MFKQSFVIVSIVVLSTTSYAQFSNPMSPQASNQSKAQVEMSEKEKDVLLMKEDATESAYGLLFNEEDFLSGLTPWSQFDNVIVVNKAANGSTAQSLKLYSHRQLILETKVSTGREDVEKVSMLTGFFRKFGKGSTTSHWRHTTRGFYTIKRIENSEYRSGESKFKMPYALFFNSTRGLAIHQVPPDLSSGEKSGENALGTRASGGCVRIHKNVMPTIHQIVTSAGKGSVPVIDTKTGIQKLDASGQPAYENWYRTLVIVQEIQD